LQMPVKNQDVVVDEDECRCPGYFEAECTAEAAQGCVWSSQGSSNGPWCQCLGDAVPVPITPVTLPPVTLPPVVTAAPEPVDDESFCAAQCQAAGNCCNDPSVGSNQQISCAQACMMRASGQRMDAMLSANEGICSRTGSSGCSLEVQGQSYSFCSSCQDLQDHCPHGVQSSDECDFGASLLPPSAVADPEPTYPIPVGWSLHSENWNCGGTASSDQDHQDSTVTTNQACADVCSAEGHAIAAFWHNNRNICRCYDTCDEGGPTVMPEYPNHVMQREFHLASTDMKCPHQNDDRLFREEELSIAACHLQCQNTEHCAHFSYGEYNGGFVCMGCTTLSNQQVHVGFNTYDMERSTPPVQMIENWDFEGMTSEGIDTTLGVNKWIHFLNTGNSGLTNTAILDWQQMGSGAGASGLFSPGGNEIAEGSHVLFLNSGDDNNYVYQNLLQPFTQTLNIEAAVGGGNGGNDGGYRMGLYAEDGSLVQEVAAGVNGAPDTSGSQYIVTHMSVSAADHPDAVGQILQLRLMKNKGAQGHYHYIRFT